MIEEGFALPSFAKINLDLRVLGKRSDGFHELLTIFQTVSLCDELVFEPADALVLTCNDPRIPTDDSNLILKAARFLQNEFGVRQGAKIRLRKNIPAPGGLGGGSSNAAVALLGLARLWNFRLTKNKLTELAARLGSDVPFFLEGGTALGRGRGTEIEPMTDIEEPYMLIVTPPVDVSTAEAFDGLKAVDLTNFSSKSILEICRKMAQTIDRRQNNQNDFERNVFEIYPEIRRVKETLVRQGSRQALLSGSGASVWAVFDNQETRQATQKALEIEQNWRMFAVSTVTRASYREALKTALAVVSD